MPQQRVVVITKGPVGMTVTNLETGQGTDSLKLESNEKVVMATPFNSVSDHPQYGYPSALLVVETSDD